MVKFAEAEKRRVGEISERRTVPNVIMDRPKINRAVWEAIRAHIMRERGRKKEEQEANAEEKRLRKERENHKKQQAMSLEKVREQIQQKEQELREMQEEKSKLMVLYRNCVADRREEQPQPQQQLLKETDIVQVQPYRQSSIPIGLPSQMIYDPAVIHSSRSVPQSYKLGPPAAQPATLLQPANIKRPHSATPPLVASYQPMPYAYKEMTVAQSSGVPSTLPSTKSISGTGTYIGSQLSYYPGSSQPPSQYPPATKVTTYLPSSAPSSLNNSTSVTSQPGRDDKHLSHVYLSNSRGHLNALPQPLEHIGKGSSSSANSFPPLPSGPQDNFYAGIRPSPSHLHHAGVLQQPGSYSHSSPYYRKFN